MMNSIVCKEILSLKNKSELSGRIVSERKENNVEVYVVKAGVGKMNSSSATKLVINQFNTDFAINAGVAGSLAKDVNINDIVCDKYIFEYGSHTDKILDKRYAELIAFPYSHLYYIPLNDMIIIK